MKMMLMMVIKIYRVLTICLALRPFEIVLYRGANCQLLFNLIDLPEYSFKSVLNYLTAFSPLSQNFHFTHLISLTPLRWVLKSSPCQINKLKLRRVLGYVEGHTAAEQSSEQISTQHCPQTRAVLHRHTPLEERCTAATMIPPRQAGTSIRSTGTAVLCSGQLENILQVGCPAADFLDLDAGPVRF